ncbi:MAG TPA: bifunctional ADP-heptose synthase [Ktedonobacterales bacterium]|nr:bifunctional ADP-heptose synthase [Ktedonobacterales bacterium]
MAKGLRNAVEQGLDRERLIRLVDAFTGKRILVVGDLVADEYIIGAPLKVSREAPVLILGQREHYTVPGGALNPGVNARTLGAEVFICGVIGDDASGARLRERLSGYGVALDGVLSEPDRPTTTKTRIFAGDSQLVRQQIVRVDVLDDSGLGDGCKRQMLAYLRATIPTVDALILSDYENGVISPEIIETAIPLARDAGKIVIVDAHGDLDRFQGVTALTPNQPEAEATLGRRISDRDDLDAAGRELLERTHAQGLLITRGSEGMSLFERGKAPLHLPAFYQGEVADPTGAGDTVAATFTLALTAGATQAEAALLANVAAGLVIQRLGNATNTPEELIAAVRAQAGD